MAPFLIIYKFLKNTSFNADNRGLHADSRRYLFIKICENLRLICENLRLRYLFRAFTYRVNRGFTLIELMLVIVIISTILVMSVPQFRSTFRDLQLRNFIHNLISLSYYAREKAVLERKIFRINLDFPRGLYWLSVKEPETGEFIKLNERLVRAKPVPEGIHAQPDTDHIDFYPDGRIDKVSISIIKDNRRSYIITSDGNSGFLKFQTPQD